MPIAQILPNQWACSGSNHSLPFDTACVEVNTFGFEDNIFMTWK